METATFEKNSIDWQSELLQRQIGEWISLKLQQLRLPPLPRSTVSPQLLEILFWSLLIVLGIWCAWMLWPRLRVLWDNWQQPPGESRESRSLPPQQHYTTGEWLQQAQTLRQQGNYAEACRAVYMAVLQRLNDTKEILHDPSRSDGEYLHLTQHLPQPNSYQTLIETHEQTCFGNGEITERNYVLCQQAYQEIDVP
jgi:hypothetical protein